MPRIITYLASYNIFVFFLGSSFPFRDSFLNDNRKIVSNYVFYRCNSVFVFGNCFADW